MFRFEHIEYLYALLLIPFFSLLFILYSIWKKRSIRRFGDWEVIAQLMPLLSWKKQVFKFIILMLAFGFLVIGLANPQIGSRLEKVQRKGADLVIALDVSNSMLSQDIRPDRLTRAVQGISKLIDRLEGDRLGIVVFAGKAYVQLPITTDYSAAKMFLSTISTQMVPSQGTAIGEAVELAIQSFKEDERSKAIIIITDGENHEGNVLEAAQDAAEKGIKIFTIGMGSPEGSPIPVFDNFGRQTGFKTDRQGQTIISKLDETTLQQLASAGNGIYVRASTGQDGLGRILDEINALEKQEIETRMFSEYEGRFQYFLAIGLILLIFEFLIPERKSRWADKIKLFNR
ncbi:MAG: VWA domain-containing protein [Bacteroidales bacterium]|jgi:Ca-activated chloride channel family protein|nr:VWA domain-containing protein [Bacteroidales bacterium]